MLKNDTLKNGTSHIGLYGSAPPGVRICVSFGQSKCKCSRWERESLRTVESLDREEDLAAQRTKLRYAVAQEIVNCCT